MPCQQSKSTEQQLAFFFFFSEVDTSFFSSGSAYFSSPGCKPKASFLNSSLRVGKL